MGTYPIKSLVYRGFVQAAAEDFIGQFDIGDNNKLQYTDSCRWLLTFEPALRQVHTEQCGRKC